MTAPSIDRATGLAMNEAAAVIGDGELACW